MSRPQPATAWVRGLLAEIDADAIPESLRVALLALSTYADADGTNAYPSGASIGAVLGIGPRAARQRLLRLDRVGLTIRTDVRPLGEYARRIVRRIDRDRLEDLASRTASQGAAREQDVTEPNGTPEHSERHGDDSRTASQGAMTIPDHSLDHSLRHCADEIGASLSDDDQEDDSMTQLSIMPDATGTAPVVRIADRTGDPFDSVWAAFVELFGEPTTPTKALRAKICRELADRGADGAEITRRAAALVELWGDARYVTDTTVWKHWSRFDGMISHVDDRAIEAAKTRDRRAAIDAEKNRLAVEGPWGIEAGE